MSMKKHWHSIPLYKWSMKLWKYIWKKIFTYISNPKRRKRQILTESQKSTFSVYLLILFVAIHANHYHDLVELHHLLYHFLYCSLFFARKIFVTFPRQIGGKNPKCTERLVSSGFVRFKCISNAFGIFITVFSRFSCSKVAFFSKGEESFQSAVFLLLNVLLCKTPYSF